MERLAQVIDLQELTDEQQEAVLERSRDLIVTAGAGSGKTRTLVARYLGLLAEGCSPRQVTAITFTDKAAREMRNRVRRDLHQLRDRAPLPDKSYWSALADEMEAARIGTIHSLCAEMLRAHPAEAGIDPQFEVLDEDIASIYKNDSVEYALAWAVEQEDMVTLFAALDILSLERILSLILEQRLDFEDRMRVNGDSVLLSALEKTLASDRFAGSLAALEEMEDKGILEADAGALMAGRIEMLLKERQLLQDNLLTGDLFGAACRLYGMRRQWMSLQGGKRDSQAKEILREIRDHYDLVIDPWIGGQKNSDKAPSLELENNARRVIPLLEILAERTLQIYQERKDSRGALDFDDLESAACQLLALPAIQSYWESQIEYLLVDEFQDTNERQKKIIVSVAGERPGRLFLVGDAQQSIYRFRGADVEVFIEMQSRIQNRGGGSLRLDTTFRSHKKLLDGIEALLVPVIGEIFDPDHPYAVPYMRMTASRSHVGRLSSTPTIEFILAQGDAETGREAAAQALADRLIEMKNAGQIMRWDDTALLFRASSGFRWYEDALDRAGIPFLTVAGVGFYDRPEIRDLLNCIRALRDPWDDTAMAGFLRSPAVGMMDSSLIALRGEKAARRRFYQALQEYETLLPEEEHPAAVWALQLLERFNLAARQQSISELLGAVVETLDYRALVMAESPRMVRNVDKLVEQAREGDFMTVDAFLNYLNYSRDAGVRSGEAVSEAHDSVQLMTIHKAKGLEFPVVVLADASHAGTNISNPLLLQKQTGLALKLAEQPLLYRFARMLDSARENAETLRLLYVACTRAQEKLLLSGYVQENGSTRGSLKALGVGVSSEKAEFPVDISSALQTPGAVHEIRIGNGQRVSVSIHTLETLSRFRWKENERFSFGQENNTYLYSPFTQPEPEAVADPENGETGLNRRNWSALHASHAPAVVVGRLVHKALQRWCFPGDAGFDPLMLSMLVQEGVVGTHQQSLVRKEAQKILLRFQRHDLYQEVAAATIRRHEVPYAVPLPDGRLDAGVLDLLFQNDLGWHLVDFKTDTLLHEDDLRKKIGQYRPQLYRYRRACSQLLGGDPDMILCFLDAPGRVIVINNP